MNAKDWANYLYESDFNSLYEEMIQWEQENALQEMEEYFNYIEQLTKEANGGHEDEN